MFCRGASPITRRLATSPPFRWPQSNPCGFRPLASWPGGHNATLRSLTGLGCSSCSTSVRLDGAECNHPTAFAAQPLLAGSDQPHYGWFSDRSEPKPVHYPYACTPAFGKHLIRVHYSLPSSLTCLATGTETPSLYRRSRPFYATGRSPPRFLGRGKTHPRPGFGNYHQTLFKGTDGRRRKRLRLSLLGWSERHGWSCDRVAPIHASS